MEDPKEVKPTRKDLEKLNLPEIAEWLEDGDGHGIYKPEFYTDLGFSPDIVKKYTRVHESDGTPKGTIFSDDGIYDKLMGIYNLDFLKWFARYIGADTSEGDSKMGRGFAARCYGAASLKRLKQMRVNLEPKKRNLLP